MKSILSLLLICILMGGNAQELPQAPRIVKGFCIAAPKPDRLGEFVRFMKEELGANGINTLILRVDYNYAFTSYPNLSEEAPLSAGDVALLAATADSLGMEIIPQINLLGHQSWASKASMLLEEYPQFDETPHVELPAEGTYEWPNDDGLYCKSYCPLHPGVHEVVFALVDEVMEAFGATAFHAGMDEVFYLANEKCPRCAGKDKAELFAGEVAVIRTHLAGQGQELWIWGDRLLDGKVTGLGMWEASENGTYPAVDLVPGDVVICDWHYEDAAATPAYFATKGFQVVSCFWNRPEVATAHMEMMALLQQNGPALMSSRFLGTMQTVWSPAGSFLDAFYGRSSDEAVLAQVASFRAMVSWDAE